MNNELKVTKEAVLAAAVTDPRSKPMLEKLFPEAFKPVWTKLKYFKPIRKEGKRALEWSLREDADIWIDTGAFNLVPESSVYGGTHYRLELKE